MVFFSLCFVACNNDEPEILETETCLEGWVENETGNGIYYRKCPQNLTKCTKTLKMFLNVMGEWQEGPGLLIIRNFANGQVEEIRREEQITSQRYELIMTLDRSQHYTHEVTLELPSSNCTINGQFYFYTYVFDIPCDGFAHLKYDICK